MGAAVARVGSGFLAASAGGEHVAELLDFFPQLDQRNDAGALLLVPEEDALAEDVHRDDLLRADRGSQRLPSLGKRFRAVT